ncbi:hypothetical protein AGMMS50262_23810 [Bacteroidia bacterium]|nr:hypothetical protein AGMMS50262_23810 [Bacteroidia bacterium]
MFGMAKLIENTLRHLATFCSKYKKAKTSRFNIKNKTSQDKFGNRVEIQHYADGKKKKITSPRSTYSEFEFLGDVYSVVELHQNSEMLKEYYRYSDEEAFLQCDRYGRLWLYFYDYYSDHHRKDYLWAVVADEADADSLVKDTRLSRLREPYIACDGEGWQAAHEWIKE